MRVVLGIDPGLCVLGVAVLAQQGSQVFLLDARAVVLSSDNSIAGRLKIIYEKLKEIVEHYKVSEVSLETPFLGKNTQNFLKLGYVRGIIYLLAAQHQLVIHEFSPSQMKQAVTGFGGADKDQVARVLQRLFPGLTTCCKRDMTDALGIALCAVWSK